MGGKEARGELAPFGFTLPVAVAARWAQARSAATTRNLNLTDAESHRSSFGYALRVLGAGRVVRRCRLSKSPHVRDNLRPRS
jgi:hypothetical protein